MIYIWAKKGHLFFVAMTVLLFNLRYWMLFAKPEKPLPGVLKVLPHLNDTTLLFTGLWIMTIAHWTPFGNANWLGVKLLLVVAYVLVGMKGTEIQAPQHASLAVLPAVDGHRRYHLLAGDIQTVLKNSKSNNKRPSENQTNRFSDGLLSFSS